MVFETEEEDDMREEWIVYFSRAGENYMDGRIRQLETGNTACVAGTIEKLTGAKRFALEPAEPYPQDYCECIDRARREQMADARPALCALPQKIAAGSTIYLGYPNYWGTMPMPVFTFLEETDLAGCRICPFCTHEGGGVGRSIQDIRRLCPDTMIRRALLLRGNIAREAEDQVREWLEEVR